MSISTLTPNISTQLHSLFSHQNSFKFKTKHQFPPKSASILTPKAALSDPFVLQIAETFEDALSSSSIPSTLQKLRDSSSESLLSLSWPSRKDEPFRFTDTSFIKSSEIQPITKPPQDFDFSSILENTHVPNLTIIDGFMLDSLSDLSGLPEGVFVGSLSKLNSEGILKRVSEYVANFEGDLFWSLNGVGAPDLIIVYVPEGCRVENPLNFRYFSMKGSDLGSKKLPVSNPRVLVLVEKGGEVSIVEEFVSDDDNKCYWTNSVVELIIGEGATVNHSYVQTQSLGAAHIKWTSIRQESASTYKLVEFSSGGKLSRHNLHVQQVGPDTVTELSTLHLSINDQTQDLHSSLVLDHPRGYTNQLHKCIVAHPHGQAVFDGNVKVLRNAQQTDAGQLTRSLLLVPQATVNVKPNLQIIADDVKCSHGAAISDLEDDQLFYFQARGIDLETARRALIFSFGAEVIDQIPFAHVREKTKSRITELLDPTKIKSSA
ncbi:protein ABCI7, chloroplastic [Amaranthus tricolor]|uniref:protein ABCI7, chloroplastic n=1 Tax=Amaranthus tricolor TaxID=29722 RepID=UPI002587A56F|nr:protein ABCI7, chloroplastic [Amaranthus tricolor]